MKPVTIDPQVSGQNDPLVPIVAWGKGLNVKWVWPLHQCVLLDGKTLVKWIPTPRIKTGPVSFVSFCQKEDLNTSSLLPSKFLSRSCVDLDVIISISFCIFQLYWNQSVVIGSLPKGSSVTIQLPLVNGFLTVMMALLILVPKAAWESRWIYVAKLPSGWLPAVMKTCHVLLLTSACGFRCYVCVSTSSLCYVVFPRQCVVFSTLIRWNIHSFETKLQAPLLWFKANLRPTLLHTVNENEAALLTRECEFVVCICMHLQVVGTLFT